MLHIFLFYKTQKSREENGVYPPETAFISSATPTLVNPLSSISMIRYTKPGRYSLYFTPPPSIFPGIRFLDMDPVPLNIRSAKGKNPGKEGDPVRGKYRFVFNTILYLIKSGLDVTLLVMNVMNRARPPAQFFTGLIKIL
ncbi:hypothetical protein TNCT_215511 [Trichonephila clavata]|uniref:Uncharacterized protein n=1 Tax=Trichonephila clavata TaxID=2740835 RepID=A0A8X6FYK1_TRICU|nr:hypothetical protein TNCT_215511 [Trichonephila clavata]